MYNNKTVLWYFCFSHVFFYIHSCLLTVAVVACFVCLKVLIFFFLNEYLNLIYFSILFYIIIFVSVFLFSYYFCFLFPKTSSCTGESELLYGRRRGCFFFVLFDLFVGKFLSFICLAKYYIYYCDICRFGDKRQHNQFIPDDKSRIKM